MRAARITNDEVLLKVSPKEMKAFTDAMIQRGVRVENVDDVLGDDPDDPEDEEWEDEDDEVAEQEDEMEAEHYVTNDKDDGDDDDMLLPPTYNQANEEEEDEDDAMDAAAWRDLMNSPVNNALAGLDDDEDDDILALPVMNYSDVPTRKCNCNKSKARRVENVSRMALDDEDDVLMPPSE